MRPSSLVALSIAVAGAPGTVAVAAPTPACGEVRPFEPGNQRLPLLICASAGVGPDACLQAIFGSPVDLLTQTFVVPPAQAKEVPTIASAMANALAGGNRLAQVTLETLSGVPVPTVPLNADPCDPLSSNGDGTCGPGLGNTPHASFAPPLGPTLNLLLSDEQEALLGCGPFWSTDCEGDGISLSDVSFVALTQSWVGFDGHCARSGASGDWHLGNGQPQPGTLGFAPGPLDPWTPMHSPFLADGLTPNPDYAVERHGSIDGIVIPLEFGASAGQRFASELAALSFNFQLLLVALTAATDDPEPDQLDPADPYAAYDPGDPGTSSARGRCSFLQPQHCRTVRALLAPEPGAGLGAAAACAALAALGASRRRRHRSVRRTAIRTD